MTIKRQEIENNSYPINCHVSLLSQQILIIIFRVSGPMARSGVWRGPSPAAPPKSPPLPVAGPQTHGTQRSNGFPPTADDDIVFRLYTLYMTKLCRFWGAVTEWW